MVSKIFKELSQGTHDYLVSFWRLSFNRFLNIASHFSVPVGSHFHLDDILLKKCVC